MRGLVDAQAGNAIDLGIEPSVMVTEEADLRADTSDQVIEPLLQGGKIGYPKTAVFRSR